MATWHTPATLRAQWANAPKNDAVANQLLSAAKDQVLAFAPSLTSGLIVIDGIVQDASPDNPPDRYVFAQGMQARYIWERQIVNVGSEDAIGLEGYQPRVGSMDKATRDLLRPPGPPIGIG